MKFQTVSALAILLSIAPALHAQRGAGGGRGGGAPQGGGGPQAGGGPQGGGRPQGGGGRASGGERPAGGPSAGANRPAQIDAQSRATRNVPSTNILPITNPILPMGNPVQPIIRYGGVGYPQVVIPTTTPYRMPGPDRGRPGGPRYGKGDVPVVVYGGGPYFYSDLGYYPPPYGVPPTVPGQLPGYLYDPGYYDDPQESEVRSPDPNPPNPPNLAPVQNEPIFYPEQHIIITPPDPERVLVPPAPGTSKAEVLARYGQPWGSIWARGKETLYFAGLTLVLEDGKVSQAR